MANISVLKIAGLFSFLGGIAAILFPLFYVMGASHPPGIETQFLFLSIGLLLGGWITGIGAMLLLERDKYITYGVVVSGIGLFAVVLIAGTADIT